MEKRLSLERGRKKVDGGIGEGKVGGGRRKVWGDAVK